MDSVHAVFLAFGLFASTCAAPDAITGERRRYESNAKPRPVPVTRVLLDLECTSQPLTMPNNRVAPRVSQASARAVPLLPLAASAPAPLDASRAGPCRV